MDVFQARKFHVWTSITQTYNAGFHSSLATQYIYLLRSFHNIANLMTEPLNIRTYACSDTCSYQTRIEQLRTTGTLSIYWDQVQYVTIMAMRIHLFIDNLRSPAIYFHRNTPWEQAPNNSITEPYMVSCYFRRINHILILRQQPNNRHNEDIRATRIS